MVKMVTNVYQISFMRLLSGLALLVLLIGCTTTAPDNSIGFGGLKPKPVNTKKTFHSLNEKIAQNPNNPAVYNVRGSAYGEIGEDEKALEDFDQAIMLDQNYYLAHANRAFILTRLGQRILSLIFFMEYRKFVTSYG